MTRPDLLTDPEGWRVSTFRSMRRLWLFAFVTQIFVLVFLIREQVWASIAPVLTSVIVLAWSRFMISERGQAWLKMFR